MIFKIILCNRPKPAARCSRPLCSSQSTGGTPTSNPTQGKPEEAQRYGHEPRKIRIRSLRTQQRAGATSATLPIPTASGVLEKNNILHTMSNVPPMSSQRRTDAFELGSGLVKSQMLLRKEVIQPHLPVRLPCYDLVLITNPTFDGSLQKG
jgi:hypothetical protein